MSKRLTTTQASALVELRVRGSLHPSSRSFDKIGRRSFARRTLQALVDAGHAKWATSVRGTRNGPVTYDGFIVPVEREEVFVLRDTADEAYISDFGVTATEKVTTEELQSLIGPPVNPPTHAKEATDMPKTTQFRTCYMDYALYNLDEVIEHARQALKDVDYDTLVGTGFSGGVVIPALALALGKNYVLIRKETDDSHHGPGRLLGVLGERWIFVDDFISSGRTWDRVASKIEAGATLNDHVTQQVGSYMYADHYNRPAGYLPAATYVEVD